MEIFQNNYFFIYIWICLSVFNYSNFTDNHKVITLYFINFAVIILHIFNYVTSISLLFISLFIFLEIFSDDNVKMIIFDKTCYKLLDYFFIIFFQYSIFEILLALSLFHYSHHTICHILAIIFFLLTIINITRDKFTIATVTELKSKCNPSINKIPFDEIDSDIFELLIDIEDITYRERGNHYTFLSKYLIKSKFKKICENKTNIRQYINNTNIIRGYSTLPMQLIRTIGIKTGFATFRPTKNICDTICLYSSVIRRKIYELVYAELFFNGLRNYYEKNVYINSDRYKDYLIYIYLKNAPTVVGNTKYDNIFKFMDDEIENWTKEKCLIAYAGLPHVGVGHGLSYNDILKKHADQIRKYKLDKDTIYRQLENIN